MTIAEIANVAQVSQRTVRRVVAEKYPDKMANGKKTTFGREEATAVMADLRKLGFVLPEQPRQIAEVPRQAAQVTDPALIAALVRETVRALLPEMRALLSPAPKAITYTHRAITSTYSPLIPLAEGQARLSRQAMPICASRAAQVLEVSNNRIARQAQRMGIGSGHAYTREQILSIWGGIYARHVLAVKGPRACGEAYREPEARKMLEEVRS